MTNGTTANTSGIRPRWFAWGGRGAASLIDQAAFAGTNFLINIMLARWLPLGDYGLFASVYAVIVFANSMHAGLIAEPLTIFWTRNRERRDAYLAEMVTLNLLFMTVIALIGVFGAIACLAFGLAGVSGILVALILGMTLPMFWFMRQVAYAQMKPWRAVSNTIVYAICLLGGALMLKAFGVAGWLDYLALMGVAAALASCWAVWRDRLPPPRRTADAAMRAMFGECWDYGRWSVPTGTLIWFANNIFLLILPVAASSRDAGQLKMVLNILLPFQQVLLGLSLVALPVFSRLQTERHFGQFRRLTAGCLIIAALGGLCFAALLCIAGQPAFALIYGARHAAAADLVLYGLALPFFWALTAVARVVLRARQEVKGIFLAYCVAAGVIGPIAIPIGALHGTAGALLGTTALHVTVACMLLFYIIRRRDA